MPPITASSARPVRSAQSDSGSFEEKRRPVRVSCTNRPASGSTAAAIRRVKFCASGTAVSGSAEKEDSFTVNGVAFSYKTSSGSNYRYHLSGAGGGAVSADGQQVRIGYVTGGDGVNSIVKLEVAK